MRNQITLETLKGRIFRIRGQQVMLGQDLAQLYESTPGALMQAVKRNAFRFPVDFMFQLSEAEFDRLKSQIVISKGRGGLRRARPYAFNEHGIAMLSSVFKESRGHRGQHCDC